jgi:hypothetical protein
MLHDMKLLTWTRRVIACRGWRAQISNAYSFSSKAISYQSLISAPNLNTSGAAVALDAPLLAARRAEMHRRAMERYRI